MPYLVLNTADADTLSRELYLLMRPEHVREPEDTIYHSGRFTHPDTGQEAIELPTDTTLRIHPESDKSRFVDLVEQWESANAADEARTQYENNVGDHVLAKNVLPSQVSDQVKTREEMEAEGWFPEDPTL